MQSHGEFYSFISKISFKKPLVSAEAEMPNVKTGCPAFASNENEKNGQHSVSSENCSVALHLTAGHAHDGRQFESLYESLDPDNVLEAATMDKAYDADRVRERLSYDGVEAVIPPIPTTVSPLSERTSTQAPVPRYCRKPI